MDLLLQLKEIKFFCHARAILDGKMLHPGTLVEFTYRYDEYENRYSAEDVTGGKNAPPQDFGGGNTMYNPANAGGGYGYSSSSGNAAQHQSNGAGGYGYSNSESYNPANAGGGYGYSSSSVNAAQQQSSGAGGYGYSNSESVPS